MSSIKKIKKNLLAPDTVCRCVFPQRFYTDQHVNNHLLKVVMIIRILVIYGLSIIRVACVSTGRFSEIVNSYLSVSERRAIFTPRLIHFSAWFNRKIEDRAPGNFCILSPGLYEKTNCASYKFQPTTDYLV